MVGEQKIQRLVHVPAGAQVLPNFMLNRASQSQSNTYNHGTTIGSVTVNVPANTSRATASQMAIATGREIQLRTRRFG